MLISKNSSIEQQVAKLTSDLMHKYYCENDVQFVIEQMDNDIMWLGAGEYEYLTGFKDVSNIFRKFAGQVPKCNISDEEYNVIQMSPKSYLCTGRMWIATDESTQISLRVHQRITTAFRQYDEYIKCCHIHISNPYVELAEEDIGFPNKMAKQSYDYLQEQIERQKKKILEQTLVLEKMSYQDTLTGLYNRNKFNEILDVEQSVNHIGVACFDLNGLKEINDRFGHSAGDEIICNTAEHINKFFYGKGYRTGGDEFVVIDSEMNEAQFYNTVNLAKKAMEQAGISCSVGACWRIDNCNVKQQLDQADKLMYKEKREHYKRQNNIRHFREYK